MVFEGLGNRCSIHLSYRRTMITRQRDNRTYQLNMLEYRGQQWVYHSRLEYLKIRSGFKNEIISLTSLPCAHSFDTPGIALTHWNLGLIQTIKPCLFCLESHINATIRISGPIYNKKFFYRSCSLFLSSLIRPDFGKKARVYKVIPVRL